MADINSIDIPVRLTPKEVQQQGQKLQKAIQNALDGISTAKLESKGQKLASNLAKIATKASEAGKKLDDALDNTKLPTAEFTRLNQYIDESTEKVNLLTAQMKKAETAGFSGEQLEPFTRQITELETGISKAKAEMQQLVDTGKAFTFNEAAESVVQAKNAYAQLNNEARVGLTALSEYTGKVDEMAQKQSAANDEVAESIAKILEIRLNAGEVNLEIDETLTELRNVNSQLDQVRARMAELEQAGAGIGHEEFDHLLSVESQLVEKQSELNGKVAEYREEMASVREPISTWERVKSLFKQMGKDLAHPIKSIQQLTSGITKASGLLSKFSGISKLAGTGLKSLSQRFSQVGKSASSFGNKLNFKNILGYAIGIRSLFSLFGKLRSAIKEGIDNLAQTRGGMNQTNQAISAMMSSLNALKNAWGAAFAPIVQVVAPYISRFLDMVTSVVNRISMLISSITGKSTAIVAKKQSANYASSLNKSGSKTSGQEKYDKAVAKAQSKYDEKVKKTEAKNAEALAKAEEKQAKAADKLAKKQEKANKELGAYDQLNVIAKDDIEELEDIQATEYEMPELELPNMEDFMGGGTDFDGMFEEVPIESAIKDLIDRIKEAWESADFTQFGKEVAQKLKEWSDTVTQWLVGTAQPLAEKIGKSVGTFLNGLVDDLDVADSIGTMLGEVLNTVVYGLNSFFDSVNWEQIGAFLAEGLNGIIDAVDWEALGHLLISKWNALFEMLDGFAKQFDFKKLGESIAQGIETIFNDFDAKAFGSAIGGWVSGIFETISGFFEKIKWFELGQTLVKKIIEMLTSIDWIRVFESMFEAIGAVLGGVSALILGLMYQIGELLVSAWNEMLNWFMENAINESGEFTIEGFLNGIIEALKNIGQWIVDHIFKPFVDGFKKAFGIASPSKEMKSLGTMLMDGLKNGISEKIASVVQKFTELKNKIVSVFNSLKSSVINVWNNMWSGIKRVINSILGGVEKMANGIVRGFNKMISAMNNLSFDIPDWVPEIGGKTFGFHIPQIGTISIPRLAQGAVIPPNREFLAMLGDQSRGVNIEAPLDTIVQAFDTALNKRSDSSSKEPIVLQLDGRVVAEAVWDEEEKRYKQRGVSYSPIFAM